MLVHGLFVNADHFRKQMPVLAAAGFRVFAIDLLGNGYSSKPAPTSDEAMSISGENQRQEVKEGLLREVELGTVNGGTRVADVALSHPVKGSVYNFYTWAEQLSDFALEVAAPADKKVVLVCNSIGTISALQASIDRPGVFDGCFIINPNFRELHVAESPSFIQPIVRAVQVGLIYVHEELRRQQNLFPSPLYSVSRLLAYTHTHTHTHTHHYSSLGYVPMVSLSSMHWQSHQR